MWKYKMATMGNNVQIFNGNHVRTFYDNHFQILNGNHVQIISNDFTVDDMLSYCSGMLWKEKGGAAC